MPGGRQQRVDRITGCSEQVIASQPPVRLHVSDHRLDRRPASQFPLDRRRQTPPLSRNEHPIRLGVVVPTIALIELIRPMRLAFGDAHHLRRMQASLFGRFRSSEFGLSGVMALTVPRALASLRNRRTGPSIMGLEE